MQTSTCLACGGTEISEITTTNSGDHRIFMCRDTSCGYMFEGGLDSSLDASSRTITRLAREVAVWRASFQHYTYDEKLGMLDFHPPHDTALDSPAEVESV